MTKYLPASGKNKTQSSYPRDAGEANVELDKATWSQRFRTREVLCAEMSHDGEGRVGGAGGFVEELLFKL